MAEYQLTMATADPGEEKCSMNKNQTNSVSPLWRTRNGHHLCSLRLRQIQLVTPADCYPTSFLYNVSPQSHWNLLMNVHSRFGTRHARSDRHTQRRSRRRFSVFFVDCLNKGKWTWRESSSYFIYNKILITEQESFEILVLELNVSI